MASKNTTVSSITGSAQNELLTIGNAALSVVDVASAALEAADAEWNTATQSATEDLAGAITSAKEANKGLKALGHVGLDLAELPRMPHGFGGNSTSTSAPRKSKRSGGGTRPHNDLSLELTILGVLAPAKAPMSPTEVEEAAVAGGYKTSSSNFSTIVNQALGRLKEGKRVKKPGRAQYEISTNGVKFLERELAAIAEAAAEG